ncbi:MAG: sulfur carrier protein ThiS [Elusimicrobia bacterium]|nr:sulfur carrier protein ThiS [Elusimicrobiota bacterium]
MKIKLNGKEAEIETGLSVDALLAGMAVVPKAALVELNLKVLRRESWKKTALKEGDAVEVFSFVTGG